MHPDAHAHMFPWDVQESKIGIDWVDSPASDNG